MVILILIVWGLCLGSFINALVWRVYLSDNTRQQPKSKKRRSPKDYSVIHGRSMCVNCEHDLSWKDLIPVFSWISLRGRCRYCSTKISWQYPLVEVATALLFVLSYIAWPESLDLGYLDLFIFFSWLLILVGFISLFIYDLKWMILPNKIIYPLIIFALIVSLIKIVTGSDIHMLFNLIAGVLVGGGLFWVIFQISDGKWIGGGDVKLGFLIGATLADPYMTFMVIFLASTIGSLYIIPGIILKKFNSKSKIPFGPFLITATIIVYLFGNLAIEWYKRAALGIV